MDEPIAAAPIRRRFGWGRLSGRSGRREYWLYVGIIIALSIGLSFIPGLERSNSGMIVLLMFAQVRRIHDFGRTGWWAVGVALAPLAITLPLMATTSIDLAVGVGTLVELALIILVGAIPGDVGENRFGPPIPFGLKRSLTGR